MCTTIALVPSYEPTGTLLPIVRELDRRGMRVIVVDDGSGPDFADVFSAVATSADVVSYEENAGKGTALKRGYDWICAHGLEGIVVTLDGDGQHAPDDVGRVALRARANPLALTLGVRTFDEETPLRSRLGNGITRIVFRLATGHALTDTQTGLRAFGTELLPLMEKIEGERYEYEMNVLVTCDHEGIPLVEVPISTIYENDNAGSHFDTVRDSLLVYGKLLRFAASSFGCFLLDYTLFALLGWLTMGLGAVASVAVSNVGARLVSSSVNFAVNRSLVFRSKGAVLSAAVRYFSLAAAILVGNTLVLGALVGVLGMNELVAKVLVELGFFFVSYVAQHRWIFREGPRGERRARKAMRPIL